MDDNAADTAATDDSDDAVLGQPVWIPDVVCLGTIGSGSGGGDMAGAHSLSSWLGW